MKSARRLFVEALTKNWELARDSRLDKPNTKDERALWLMVRAARSEDINMVLETVFDDVRSDTPREDVLKAWTGYHPTWAARTMPGIIARAIGIIRDVKHFEREVWRTKYPSRRKTVGVFKKRRVWVRKSGERPSLTPNIKCLKKFVHRKSA